MSNTSQDIQVNELVKQAIRIAQALAKENMNADINAAHLLKALMHRDIGLQGTLKQMDQDIYYIEEWAEVRIESLPKSTGKKDLLKGDNSLDEIFNEADTIRLKLNAELIEPLHILAAISTPGVGFTYEQLKSFPLKRDDLLKSVVANEEFKEVVSSKKLNNSNGSVRTTAALAKYCIDKTQLAREGRIDPIVGRDKETRMMAEILCRRSKPNVLITGEPGVGKTALVDGFALNIMEKKVPGLLQDAQVFELDAGALIAGASYKGEIEDRLKNIIAEIKKFDRAVLFIDEIHSLVDKHGAAGGAINLLKPELARGELTVIGATTVEEYRKFIEPDEAFNRRFELLSVDEPTPEVCFQMLKKILPKYEAHHGIEVPDETIRETIRLSSRYIKEKRLPDAAIDLIDRSLAALAMINDTAQADLDEISNQYATLTAGDSTSNEALADLHWLIVQMKNKLSPILWTNFESEEDATKIQDLQKLKEYTSNALIALRNGASNKHFQLKMADVAAIVSYKTGIPLGKVQTQERERLLNMEGILKKRVVGQDHAIKTISEAILESRSGLSKPGQPIGSFFFLGPTGTGKTELAKALANFLFQDESFMIRFDMSEFKEEQSAALLYGASPGYVGYEEGGLLVNKIRQKPYSVVLFDEIEKAHSSVFDIFLQIMDEGKLHDKLGKEGDFSNAVIIFTSNIGSQYVVDSFGRDETPSSNKLMEIMTKHFRPEFLGRLTEIIPFAPMNKTMVQSILEIQLKTLHEALKKQGIGLTIESSAMTTLADMGFTPAYGARPLGAVIRSQLRKPLSRKIITGEIMTGSEVKLVLNEKNELIWKID